MLPWRAAGWEGEAGGQAGSEAAVLAQSLPAAGDGAACHRGLNSPRGCSQMLQLHWQRRVKNLTAASARTRGREGVISLLLSMYPDILADQLSDGEN